MPRGPKLASTPTPEEVEESTALAVIEQNASLGVVPLADSPALNKLLMRHARESFNDISAATGIPVGEVAERMVDLLDNKNWRDDLMEEKLLLAEVGMLVNDIRTRMSRRNVEDEGWASMARVQLQAIKTLMEQLDKRRKAVDGKLSLVTMMQAQLMAEAIRIAQERAVLNIQRKYPDMDPDIIYVEFEEALPEAIAFLEARADG
jgi:hypothetical protein